MSNFLISLVLWEGWNAVGLMWLSWAVVTKIQFSCFFVTLSMWRGDMKHHLQYVKYIIIMLDEVYLFSYRAKYDVWKFFHWNAWWASEAWGMRVSGVLYALRSCPIFQCYTVMWEGLNAVGLMWWSWVLVLKLLVSCFFVFDVWRACAYCDGYHIPHAYRMHTAWIPRMHTLRCATRMCVLWQPM